MNITSEKLYEMMLEIKAKQEDTMVIRTELCAGIQWNLLKNL